MTMKDLERDLLSRHIWIHFDDLPDAPVDNPGTGKSKKDKKKTSHTPKEDVDETPPSLSACSSSSEEDAGRTVDQRLAHGRSVKLAEMLIFAEDAPRDPRLAAALSSVCDHISEYLGELLGDGRIPWSEGTISPHTRALMRAVAGNCVSATYGRDPSVSVYDSAGPRRGDTAVVITHEHRRETWMVDVDGGVRASSQMPWMPHSIPDAVPWKVRLRASRG